METFGFFAGLAILMWASSGFPGIDSQKDGASVRKLMVKIDSLEGRIKRLEESE